MKDHNQAVALNPNDAEGYFNRGADVIQSGQPGLDLRTQAFEAKPRNTWLHAAVLDFEKAAEKDAKNSLALDRLGLTYDSDGEADKAIRAYTQEMAFDRRIGKSKLADAYCIIG